MLAGTLVITGYSVEQILKNTDMWINILFLSSVIQGSVLKIFEK